VLTISDIVRATLHRNMRPDHNGVPTPRGRDNERVTLNASFQQDAYR
jgi:hypothetical protein